MKSRFSALITAFALTAAAVGCSPSATAQEAASERATAAGIPVPDEENIPEDLSVTTLAAGCFWCVEEPFAQLEGVYAVISGYAGGREETANYKAICTGMTKHAEAVQIYYDPEVVTFEELLNFFWDIHDPTTLNRQGGDTGPQYRSAIFYTNEEEKALAKASRDTFNASDAYQEEVVTTFEEFTTFFPAEDYHQNYYRLNPDARYVQGVLVPKLRKLGLKVID